VIIDDGQWLRESWDIAEYLDAQYPDRPMLFSGDSMKALTKLTEGWLWATAVRPWFSCYILDYHNLSLPQDQAYVRQSRETLFLQGRKLEDVQAGREERLPLVPPQLEPLRQVLKKTAWLGGDQPNYADYRVLAVFLWLASVATIPALHADDPLKDYVDRGFDLYGGLGRHPGLHTLFGLPKPIA
jgi:glutathione S-transferase